MALSVPSTKHYLPARQSLSSLSLREVWARPTAEQLAHRYFYDRAHCRQVAALTLSIFDQSQHIHRLGTWERRYLEMAALLHDIGCQVSYQAHHKHTYQLIRRTGLSEFTPEEVQVIALVARYHRKSRPSKCHRPYRQLPRELRRTVRYLSAILRLADGLDRGHAQNIRCLLVKWNQGHCQIEMVTRHDPELEVWGALHKAPFFEEVFGCTLAFAAETIESYQVAAGRTAFRWDGCLSASYLPYTLELDT